MISEHQRHISGEQMHAGSVRLLRDRARRMHDRRHRPRRVRYHPRCAQGIIIIFIFITFIINMMIIIFIVSQGPY